ncbi:MAG: SPASM domain-containing protein [Salinivirgaceae bacterium]|jgi:uncharacterized protein|nr:SPASM domain-containing protein [Salinivirgaceae bacterium]
MPDGSGSWNVILDNIDMLLKKTNDIKLTIRCNIDKTNKNDYQVLKEKLKTKWGEHSNYYIYPAVLRDHGTDHSSQCNFFSNQEASEFLLEESIKNNQVTYFSLHPPGCVATQLNSYLIGPDGEFYKCWNDLGRTDKVFGSVFTPYKINQKFIFDYIISPSVFTDKNCQDCVFFFVCEGGCQWQRLKDMEENKPISTCVFAKNQLTKYLEAYYSQKMAKKKQDFYD